MSHNKLENLKAHVLIVDDNHEIHHDFKSILLESETKRESNAILDDLLSDIFEETTTPKKANFKITVDSAYQGEEALEKITTAEKENNPYDVVFMDFRMPPGWDGIETIKQVWLRYPHTEMIICTAYSDFSWNDIQEKLGDSQHLLILKKPFDAMEVKQIVLSLTMKAAYLQK